MNDNALPSPSTVAQQTTLASLGGEPIPYADPECPAGGTCGGEGVVLPFDLNQPELDQLFELDDISELPSSDEVFPVIFDDAPMSEEGVLDCFARHYPTRAGILLSLLNLGYEIEYIDALENLPALLRRDDYLDSRVSTLESTIYRSTPLYINNGEGFYVNPFQNDPFATFENDLTQSELYSLQNEETANNRRIGVLGEWEIADNKIKISNIIDPAYQDGWALFSDSSYGTDPDWNVLPTNKEGADRLNALIGNFMTQNGIVIRDEDGSVADSGRENPRARTKRWLVGTVSTILGAAEMIGGVVVAVGSGGIAAAGGVALTVVGFDTFTVRHEVRSPHL